MPGLNLPQQTIGQAGGFGGSPSFLGRQNLPGQSIGLGSGIGGGAGQGLFGQPAQAPTFTGIQPQAAQAFGGGQPLGGPVIPSGLAQPGLRGAPQQGLNPVVPSGLAQPGQRDNSLQAILSQLMAAGRGGSVGGSLGGGQARSPALSGAAPSPARIAKQGGPQNAGMDPQSLAQLLQILTMLGGQ